MPSRQTTRFTSTSLTAAFRLTNQARGQLNSSPSKADQAALSALRKLPMVDYVEPVMVQGDLHAFAGVGGCDWGSAWTGDRQLTATRDVYSQKFTAMGIPNAWNYSAGAGVTIGLIDTGISSGQGQFTSTFATGSSAGRTMRFLKVASQSSVYDGCGHGTGDRGERDRGEPAVLDPAGQRVGGQADGADAQRGAREVELVFGEILRTIGRDAEPDADARDQCDRRVDHQQPLPADVGQGGAAEQGAEHEA